MKQTSGDEQIENQVLWLSNLKSLDSIFSSYFLQLEVKENLFIQQHPNRGEGTSKNISPQS